MDKLFPVVPKMLSESGVFYLLVLEENKPGIITCREYFDHPIAACWFLDFTSFFLDEIRDIMSSFGLVTTTVLKRKARNENLSVLRIGRQ